MAYISNGRVVFGNDNRTTPVTAPSTPAPSSTPSYSNPSSSTSSGFSALGGSTNSNPLNSGSYTYNQGSAQGPLNYNQTKQAQSTGSAYIAPANSGNSQVPPPPPMQNQQMTFEQFAKMFQQYMPQTQVPQYQTKYGTSMDEALNKIKSLQNFSFDPNSSASLKQAQSQAMNQVKQDMAARGRLYSSFTDTQQQQAAQGLIPQYEQLARQDYNTNTDNLYKQLGAITNLENANYNQYRDTVTDANNAKTQGLNAFTTAYNAYDKDRGYQSDVIKNQAAAIETKRLNDSTISKNQASMEESQYGRALTPVSRNYVQVYEQAVQIPQYREIIQSNWNNLAGAINSIPNTAENQDLLSALHGARVMKMLSDPQLLQAYGADYGFGTSVEDAKGLAQLKGYELDNIIKTTEAEIAQYTAPAVAEKALLEVEKVKQDIRKGIVDEQEGLARIDDIRMQTNLRPVSVAIQQQNANTSAYNADTSRMNANRSQSQYDDKQLETTYNDVDKYITNTYTSVDDTGRTVMSTQDKADIDIYTKKLDADGVNSSVVDALRSKYGLSKLPK